MEQNKWTVLDISNRYNIAEIYIIKELGKHKYFMYSEDELDKIFLKTKKNKTNRHLLLEIISNQKRIEDKLDNFLKNDIEVEQQENIIEPISLISDEVPTLNINTIENEDLEKQENISTNSSIIDDWANLSKGKRSNLLKIAKSFNSEQYEELLLAEKRLSKELQIT